MKSQPLARLDAIEHTAHEAFDDPHQAAPEALLSPDAVARLLGVQRRTLMTWARRGEIPHFVLKWGKDGRAVVVRFSSEALSKWIKEREQKCSPRTFR